jgi:hypothetical protein
MRVEYMIAFTKLSDGSIVDIEGDFIFISMDRFISDICEGDSCFLCGKSPKEKEFNDEHIVPKWILRKLGIFKSSITLPNGNRVRYDQYTVPCCVDCNSFLGAEIEQEIQTAIEGGIESIKAYEKENGPWKIFLWLSLIFFKTHLNDSYLPNHLDSRQGNERLSKDYDWGFLHHIHCMVRSIQTGVSINPECLGSVYVLRAKSGDHHELFDYRDTYEANTILIQVGEIAFLAVLDDSGAAAHFYSERMEGITGPLSKLQLREVLSHLTLLNLKLKYRPSYRTEINISTGKISIAAELPDLMELAEHTREEFGHILHSNIFEYIGAMDDPDFNNKNVLSGKYQVLFDKDGKFIEDSMDMKIK